MNPIIQLAKALSEKYTYEEIRDYLNESGTDIEITLDGKTFTKPMKPHEAGLAFRFYNDDPMVLIVTYPRNEPVAISTDTKAAGEILKRFGFPNGSEDRDVSHKLQIKSFAEFDENFAIDINKALGVKPRTFKKV